VEDPRVILARRVRKEIPVQVAVQPEIQVILETLVLQEIQATRGLLVRQEESEILVLVEVRLVILDQLATRVLLENYYSTR